MVDILTRGVEEANRLAELLAKVEKTRIPFKERLFRDLPDGIEDRVNLLKEVNDKIWELRKSLAKHLAYKPVSIIDQLKKAEADLEFTLKFKDIHNGY